METKPMPNVKGVHGAPVAERHHCQSCFKLHDVVYLWHTLQGHRRYVCMKCYVLKSIGSQRANEQSAKTGGGVRQA